MEIVLSAVIVAFGLLVSLIWMWAIIDIVKGNFKKENDKLVWLILVVAVPANLSSRWRELYNFVRLMLFFCYIFC